MNLERRLRRDNYTIPGMYDTSYLVCSSATERASTTRVYSRLAFRTMTSMRGQHEGKLMMQLVQSAITTRRRVLEAYEKGFPHKPRNDERTKNRDSVDGTELQRTAMTKVLRCVAVYCIITLMLWLLSNCRPLKVATVCFASCGVRKFTKAKPLVSFDVSSNGCVSPSSAIVPARLKSFLTTPPSFSCFSFPTCGRWRDHSSISN